MDCTLKLYRLGQDAFVSPSIASALHAAQRKHATLYRLQMPTNLLRCGLPYTCCQNALTFTGIFAASQEKGCSIYQSMEAQFFQPDWLKAVIAVQGRHVTEGLVALIGRLATEEVPVEEGALLIVSTFSMNFAVFYAAAILQR